MSMLRQWLAKHRGYMTLLVVASLGAAAYAEAADTAAERDRALLIARITCSLAEGRLVEAADGLPICRTHPEGTR